MKPLTFAAFEEHTANRTDLFVLRISEAVAPIKHVPMTTRILNAPRIGH